MTKQKIHIPQTIEKEVFVLLGVGEYNFNEILVSDWDSSPYASEGNEKVLLKKQKVLLDLSDSEITETKIKQELVAQLREQLKNAKAAAHQKEKAIQEKIDNLLAIEYKPDPEPETTDKRHPKKNTLGG